MTTYQTRLRELRNAAKLSQEATAEKVGISKISYQRYELGERDIPGDVLRRMAEFFGVSADYIMMTTDIATPSSSRIRQPLSLEEQELLDILRKVGPGERELIVEHAKMVLAHTQTK